MTESHRRPRVLVCDPIASEGIQLMEQQLDVDVRPGLEPEELASVIGDYEAVIVRSATKITQPIVARAERLEIIGRAGAGLDAIDVEAAVAAGIEVVNSPDANTIAVAELTLGMMLALARRVPRADAAMKAGRWEKSALMGTALQGKTVGIVGFGRIGQAVATRARAFDMNVLINQRRPTPELFLESGIQSVDLYDLLAQSDFVTLHVPARADTDRLIGSAELDTMRPSAYLINTSRGTVLDEAALLEALEEGTIAGAGLDVFAEEPAVDNPLAAHPRVVATPHIGASTSDAQTTAAIDVARKILDRLGDLDSESVLPLRFVDVAQVIPHEAVDMKRALRLAERITEEGVIRNPPLVARVDDRYVVLDGATRSKALETMGVRHSIVQDVDIDGEVELETWHHVVRAISPDDLIGVLENVDDISLEEVEPERASSRVIEYGGICSMVTVDDRGLVIHADAGINRFDALAAVAAAYIEAGTVSRTLERNAAQLSAWFPDMAALVEYPQFTVEQVLLAAGSGRLLPAGVTRFLLPGRVLRLDVPLDVLSDERTIDEKNRWLHDYLTEKERHGRIRYYREPVYLLDE